MSKTPLYLLVLAALSASLTQAVNAGGQAPAPFVRGDINMDGEQDISDPVANLLYLFDGLLIDCEDAGDYDDSGFIDIADPIAQLMRLFSNGAAPPAPYPEEGTDPTPDELCCLDACDDSGGGELPDISGIWSGTFKDDLVGEYVVVLEVVDAPDGSKIVRGFESIGNEIYGGEFFKWNDAEDEKWGLDYFTSFDIVEGDFVLDGLSVYDGEFNTQSGTNGTFTMERVNDEPPTLFEAEYAVILAGQAEDDISGGTLSIDDTLCGEGTIGGLSARAKIELSAEDGRLGVHTCTIEHPNGAAYNLIGLVAWDTGIYSGTYVGPWNDTGFFLMAPDGYDEQFEKKF